MNGGGRDGRREGQGVTGSGATRGRGIRAVAAIAGVSVGTVSNVLNNPGLVARQTRRRVEDAMEQVGFVRNGPARQLRAMTSSVVGGVMFDVGNPFFAEVARGIEDRLAEAGCMLMLCSTDADPVKESHHLRVLEEQMVRGVLVTPASTRPESLGRLQQHRLTVVLLDHPRAGTEMCAVAVDNVAGGEAVAGHVLGLGHRRVAFFRSAAPLRQTVDRRTGICNAIRALGLDIESTLIDVPLETTAVDRVAKGVAAVLSEPLPPTAIICFSDVTALGVMRELRLRDVRVPEAMSVVGYDDVDFAAQLSPALTTVRQPKYQLGRTAAELLLTEGHPGHRHQEVLFRPELVVRDSTAPPRRRTAPPDRSGFAAPAG